MITFLYRPSKKEVSVQPFMQKIKLIVSINREFENRYLFSITTFMAFVACTIRTQNKILMKFPHETPLRINNFRLRT